MCNIGAGEGWLRPPSIPLMPALRRSSRAALAPLPPWRRVLMADCRTVTGAAANRCEILFRASPPPATSAGAGAPRTNPAMRQTPARTHPSRAVFPESPSRKAASAAARVSSACTSESAGR